MEQILSSTKAFFAIIPTFIAGVTLMVTGHIEGGIVCFVVACVLLVLFFLFRRQHIDIAHIKCIIDTNSIMGRDNLHPMKISGWITARHKVSVRNCSLIVAMSKREYPAEDSEVIQEVDSNGKPFTFKIPMDNEDRGETIDYGLVYIETKEGFSYTAPFPISTKTPKSKGWFETMVKKLKSGARQLKDEGIKTKKKLYKLLDRASQPIKKSEKGKS
jgi:hypothetical protein